MSFFIFKGLKGKRFFINVIILFNIFLTSIFLIDFVEANNAFVAYRSVSGNGVNYPKIRFWNSTTNSYGSEIELPNSGSPLRYLVFKSSPFNYKLVLVTSSDDGYLDSYVCYQNCTFSSNWFVSNNFAQSIVSSSKTFDFSFETATGDLVLVYALSSTNVSRDLAYRVLSSSSVNFSDTVEFFIDDLTQSNDVSYSWVFMDNNPRNNSEYIILVGFDVTSSDINAWVWNGSSWGNQLNISESATATGGYDALAVKYNSNGSSALVIGADGTVGNVNWAVWSSSWSSVSSFDIDTSDGNDVRFLSLKANPVSLDFQAVIVDSGSDLTSMFFNGSSNSWIVTPNIDTSVDIATRRCADFDWLPDGSSGRLVWDTDTTGTTLSQRICSPLCNSSTTTISSFGGSGGWIKLFRVINTSVVSKILGIRFNSVFNIGSFYFNGSAYFNYGDSAIASGDTINTYESYSLDFIRSEKIPLIMNFVPPTDADNATITRTYSFVNLTVFPSYATCYLNWSNNIYLMLESDNVRYYNKTGLFTGTEYYYVICNASGIIEKTRIRTINIQTTFAINISLIFPNNGQIFNYSNIGFTFNVSHPVWSVKNCSLLINDVIVNTTSSSPVPQNTNITLYANLVSGNYNWSVNCTDEYNVVSSSQKRSLVVYVPPIINSIYIEDYLTPPREIILLAGSTRLVSCIVNVSDAFGVDNINYTHATFYYYLNKYSDNDDNNVHYTDNNCELNQTSVNYKIFLCNFSVFYYANNGTWNCTAFSYNKQGAYYNLTNYTIINPLYALNVTDGLPFGNVESGSESIEITANISNIGNMPINVSVQGYSLYPGDGIGMNCSDGINLSIDRIKFGLISSSYEFKTSLNGSVQNTNLRIQKQINNSLSFNSTYWQIKPDNLINTDSKYCSGFIIFGAEAG